MQNDYFPPTVPMDLMPPAAMKPNPSVSSPYMEIVSEFYTDWQTNHTPDMLGPKSVGKMNSGEQQTIFNVF